jgi:hypothetical protein
LTTASTEAGASERALLARVGGALYGVSWQGSMARALGVSDRSVRYWLSGAHPIPRGVLAELPGLIEGHRALLADVGRQIGRI